MNAFDIASTSASVDEVESTAPKTAESAAASAGTDDKVGGGETTEANGGIAIPTLARVIPMLTLQPQVMSLPLQQQQTVLPTVRRSW